MSLVETPQNSGRWANYEFLPSPIIGFHGCDKSVGEAILSGKVKGLTPSSNDYDWLGTGIYFWEGNPERAWQFALERAQGGRNSRGEIRKPFVLGATLHLKRCFNLADSSAIAQLREAYEDLELTSQTSGEHLPKNGSDLRTRKLDCAVTNMLHRQRRTNDLPAYDTVRGLFWEGAPIYQGAAGASVITSKSACANRRVFWAIFVRLNSTVDNWGASRSLTTASRDFALNLY